MSDKYFVVDQDNAIHKEGSEEECRAFISDPDTIIFAEFGGFNLKVMNSEKSEKNTQDEGESNG